jgi:hypothetical protein
MKGTFSMLDAVAQIKGFDDELELDGLDRVDFSPSERRLLNRYFRLLSREDVRARVPPAKLYYAAASAVECLRDGRKDIAVCRRNGGTAGEIACCKDVTRQDAQFYLELARGWMRRPPVLSVVVSA